MKKHTIYFICILIVSAVSLRLYSFYRSNSLPDIRLTDTKGQAITRSALENHDCFLFLIPAHTLFIDAFIKDISKVHLSDNQRLLFFIDEGDTISKGIAQNSDIFQLDSVKWKQLKSQFHSTIEDGNIFLSYNYYGNLESCLSIKPIHKEAILRNIEKTCAYLNEDSLLTKLITKIEENARSQDDGIYYYVSLFSPTCVCYNTFKELERILKENSVKLRVKLVGSWTSIDIQNLIEERNHDIVADLAQQEVSQLYNEWEQKTGRNDFNLILVKEGNQAVIFPLIDDENYKSWDDFKRTQLHKHLNNKLK